MRSLIEEVQALGLPREAQESIVFGPDPEALLAEYRESVALARYAGREDLIGMPLAAMRRRILDDLAEADIHIDTAQRCGERSAWASRAA